eukprot:PhF_6_TR27007/c0_g1_i2/m.39431
MVGADQKIYMCSTQSKLLNVMTAFGSVMTQDEQDTVCRVATRRYHADDVSMSNSSAYDIRLAAYGNGVNYIWHLTDNASIPEVPFTNESFTNWAPNEPKNLSQCIGVRLYDCLWESIPCDTNAIMTDNTTLMCELIVPAGGNFGNLFITAPLPFQNVTRNTTNTSQGNNDTLSVDNTTIAKHSQSLSGTRETIIATSAAVSIMSMASDGSGSLQVPRVSFLWQMKSC